MLHERPIGLAGSVATKGRSPVLGLTQLNHHLSRLEGYKTKKGRENSRASARALYPFSSSSLHTSVKHLTFLSQTFPVHLRLDPDQMPFRISSRIEWSASWASRARFPCNTASLAGYTHTKNLKITASQQRHSRAL